MEVKVIELIGIDPPAEKALWQYLFGIDLATSIDCWNQRVDDPLRWWLEQPRRLERKVEDGLWLRPVDVAIALSGRKYSCAGSLALRIRDSICPWNDGVWSLEVDPQGNAQCGRTNAKPTLELTAETLGMVYLGGHRFATLARSGLISGSAEAIRQADALFTWDPDAVEPQILLICRPVLPELPRRKIFCRSISNYRGGGPNVMTIVKVFLSCQPI